jgi:hypothetical protein
MIGSGLIAMGVQSSGSVWKCGEAAPQRAAPPGGSFGIYLRTATGVSFGRSAGTHATNQAESPLDVPSMALSKSFRLSSPLFSTVSESLSGDRDREKRVPAVTVFFGVLRSRQTLENTGSKIR